MNMNKTMLSTAMGLALGFAGMSAQADLSASAILEWDSGVGSCKLGGTYPNCSAGASLVNTGSYFSMDTNGNGHKGNERVPMTNVQDIHVGSSSTVANPDLLSTWSFFGAAGNDYLTSPIVDLGVDNNGNHLVDMTGWTVTWNNIPAIPMGGDTANFASDTGIGTVTCSTASCSASSTFSLDYTAHVPLGDPSNFGGVS